METSQKLPLKYKALLKRICLYQSRPTEKKGEHAKVRNNAIFIQYINYLTDGMYNAVKAVYMDEIHRLKITKENFKAEKNNGFPDARDGSLTGEDRARIAFELSAEHRGISELAFLQDFFTRIEYRKLFTFSESEEMLIAELLDEHIEQQDSSDEVPKSLQYFIDLLLSSPEWSSIPWILHDGPDININEIYTELYFIEQSQQPHYKNTQKDWKVREERGNYVHAESLLTRSHNRVVIVGAPGSGKSTLTRWLSQHLCHEGYLPVPVRLRQFAASWKRNPTQNLLRFSIDSLVFDIDKADYIYQKASKSEQDNHRIYLLDGWDEVPSDLKSELRELINRETNGSRCFITSRPSGIPETLKAGETSFFEIGALSDHAVSELCEKFATARNKTRLLPEFLLLLETTPSLWQVAANPYLLSLFCEVVFQHNQLPDRQVCSTHWVIKNAIDLIFQDHNRNLIDKPLRTKEYQQLSSIARKLSFSNELKETVFEIVESQDIDTDSALFSSRFFNVTSSPFANSICEFSHLRIQEYFAALALSHSEAESIQPSLEQILLSSIWEEEASFLAAELANNSEHIFWKTLRRLLSEPDICGELYRRAAKYLAIFAAIDGGEQLLGFDLRSILWKQIETNELFIDKNIQALLRLDPEYCIIKILEVLPTLKPNEFQHSRIIETFYRAIPFELRKKYLDKPLNQHNHFSWLVGLPARSFPLIANLDDILHQTENNNLLEEERLIAIKHLGAARAVSSINNLMILSEDTNEEISTAAIEALSKIGGKEVALFFAEQLISGTQSPSSIAALLNGLSVEGYGIIEPYSFERLMEEVEALEPENEKLEIILSALDGTIINHAPTKLLTLILKESKIPNGTRKAALGLFKGMDDTDAISRALDAYLDGRIHQSIEQRLVAAISFIPANFDRCNELWKCFTSLDIIYPGAEEYWTDHDRYQTGEYYTFRHMVKLFQRTLERSPNHPVRPVFLKMLDEKLRDKNFINSPLMEHLLLSIPIFQLENIHKGNEFKNILVNISIDKELDDLIRCSAITALKSFELSTNDHEEFKSILKDYFVRPVENISSSIALIDSLPELVFSQQYDLLNHFNSEIEEDNYELHQVLLARSQALGYLFINKRIINRLGQQISRPNSIFPSLN